MIKVELCKLIWLILIIIMLNKLKIICRRGEYGIIFINSVREIMFFEVIYMWKIIN